MILLHTCLTNLACAWFESDAIFANVDKKHLVTLILVVGVSASRSLDSDGGVTDHVSETVLRDPLLGCFAERHVGGWE